MNIFDKILASGYYAFNGELNSHMVRMFISLARKAGQKFTRVDLKMQDISKYMEFNNPMYVLKNGYTIGDIADYIDFDMVMVFYYIQKIRDKYYSSSKESPTFEEAMNNLKGYSYGSKKE